MSVSGGHTNDGISSCVDHIHSDDHWAHVQNVFLEAYSVEVKFALGVDLSQDVGVDAHGRSFAGEFLVKSEICDELRSDTHLIQALFDQSFFVLIIYDYKSHSDIRYILLVGFQLLFDAVNESTATISPSRKALSQLNIFIEWDFNPSHVISIRV